MQVPCHFLQTPWIYAVTQKPHHGPIQSPDHPRSANTMKTQIFNLSSALQTSTVTSFTDILKSQFGLCVLPTRVPPGISLMSAILPLEHLKRLSQQLWSLPIGSWTLKSQLRLMPLTMHSLLTFQS